MLSKYKKLACLVALTVAAGAAHAEWPTRPITLVVPYAAGGGTDATARIIASMLKDKLDTPVNVVNHPAGGGVVGQETIAGAKPDGYTIGLVSAETFMNHNVGLTQRSGKDYTALALMNNDPSAVIVSTSSPYKNMDDLVKAIKDNPGKLKSSGTGTGGVWNLAMAGMVDSLGISADSVKWVPSAGAAPALLELVAGGVDFVPVSLPEARSMIESGKATPLAVMATDAVALYPDVPTLKEATGSDWLASAWRGIVAPVGLPEEVTKKYEQALDEINHSDQYRDFMKNQGYEVVYLNGEDFTQFMIEGDEATRKVMDKLGLIKK
ncbi:Bug family tripartite tricarboxylate transporter substrate binding protein [Castellaniella sp.]|uniref:Bug family tripartite tricarboxylate transporter substrate binding protein n=1 Tax=Castellaniella sp. TaxID=1955812 RepID=UPI003563995A